MTGLSDISTDERITSDMSCPWCDYETKTIIPDVILFNKHTPAWWWTGVKIGYHMSINHPIDYSLLRGGDDKAVLQYYRENFPVKEELKDLTDDELLEYIYDRMENGIE